MNPEGSQLRGLYREARRRLAQRRMRKQVDRYFATGTRPAHEPAASYVALMEAFDRVANASIGGQGYEQAVEQYRAAEERYEQASREVQP